MFHLRKRFVPSLVCASVILASMLATNPAQANPSFQLADLRCEYLCDPIGIDVAKPRLSWKLLAIDANARGLEQTKYHILVAGSRINLNQNIGDLWDSGEVTSNQTTQIAYEGGELPSRMRCFWKARSCDQNGEWSDWSVPSQWSMGLLDPSDWKAKWIGADKSFARQRGMSDNTMPDPWFRKTIVLYDGARYAPFSIASIGYHELYVNGRKVHDTVLAPNVATHKVRARYVTYEIQDYLQPGENVIAVWMGVSWSIFQQYKTDDKPQTPMFLAQADILLNNGQTVQVVSDSSWKTHDSPNILLGVWDFMNYGGELYDANKEIPHWNDISLDDSSWDSATEYSPSLAISAEMSEPNRIIKTIQPVAVDRISENEYRVDMGVNFAGWLRMNLKGEPGQRIDFQYSERLDQPMTHRLHSAYIMGPSGEGVFQNRFNYHSGRWITIKGLGYKPSLDEIQGFLIHPDYKRAGEFHCSNPLLNEIYETTLWTFDNLSLGAYIVDCPQRERMGYGGDAHATTRTGLNNYDLPAFYTKWSQDWRDVQDESGNLPYTAPTYWGGGGPGWSGFCITLPWELYKRYNDVRILEINFSTMQRWLDFLETHVENDMLTRWGGQWDFLGDWLWPGANGVNGDYRGTLFFNNCYWIYNLQTAAEIAGILGEEDLAGKYNQRADAVRKAVHQEFFNPDDSCYVTGFQAYLALAIMVDLPPERLRPVIWDRLEEEILVRRQGHIHAGITGGAFLLNTLMDHNRQDLIYAMATQPDYPGWGDMIHRGATTIWEAWEGRNSILHSSYLHIGSWFINGIGGIKLGEEQAGFQDFVIQPGIFGDRPLKYASAKYVSEYGPIASSWKCNIDETEYVFSFEVPPNTTAKTILPFGKDCTIQEMQKPLDQASGVTVLEQTEDATTVNLKSGNYYFVVKLEKNEN
ncbi:MAG: family 78 glycoside hydrolase catalytic domain [Candidatus Omnitrophica bacterium]|nr:family 78 glycoside hydrolase catalytic domain [Candidatus Omnitrophota bacterium]